eukprot:COSAG05_NODE_579_length_8556_cov_44.773679_16_plen_73_part_00
MHGFNWPIISAPLFVRSPHTGEDPSCAARSARAAREGGAAGGGGEDPGDTGTLLIRVRINAVICKPCTTDIY